MLFLALIADKNNTLSALSLFLLLGFNIFYMFVFVCVFVHLCLYHLFGSQQWEQLKSNLQLNLDQNRNKNYICACHVLWCAVFILASRWR